MAGMYKISLTALLLISCLMSQNSDSLGQTKYSSFLEKHPNVPEIKFNAGFESFQKGELENAQSQFKSSLESGNKNLQFPSLYNLGNTLFSKADQASSVTPENPQSQPPSFSEAVEAYRKALSLNPTDENAKYNYELALKRMLEEPPQQQNQQDQQQQQDQSEDDSEDQDNQDQQQGQDDQKEQQEQQSQEQENKSGEETQEERQSNPQAMNQTEEKPDSETILDALRAQEKLQPKLFKGKVRSKKPEKEW